MTQHRNSILMGIALLLMAPSATYGQGVTGRIDGTVRDPSQATVPGATVTATNQETGYRAEVTSGQGGDYVVPNMPPGKYTVTVAAAGFKSAVSKNVVVIVDGLTALDFSLQVGARSDTVQVDASNQLVDTVTSSMGNDLSTRQVNALPLFGRVFPTRSGHAGSRQNRNRVLGGIRVRHRSQRLHHRGRQRDRLPGHHLHA